MSEEVENLDDQGTAQTTGVFESSLNIYQEVALEDILSLFVPLRGFVCTVIFPSQDGSTLDTVDIPDGMVASGHEAVTWFPFNDVNDAFEQVSTTMLTIECS